MTSMEDSVLHDIVRTILSLCIDFTAPTCPMNYKKYSRDYNLCVHQKPVDDRYYH